MDMLAVRSRKEEQMDAPDIDPASVHVRPPGQRPSASPLRLMNREFRGRTLLLWLMP